MNCLEFLQKIQQTILQNALFNIDSDSVLVGVSGGVDSIVLTQTLYELGCKIAIAHCNFNLRGEESDGDQEFVEQFARSRQIPIHVRTFNTIDFAKSKKESIEMAARSLRYEWFRTLCQINGYTHIAIAHNQNDSIETFFINLLRSSGLKGLTGIPIKNGTIVRPLLDVLRVDIEAFAQQSNLRYRVDSSNLKNDFVRNKIRNIIVPELQKIAPRCEFSISESIKHLQESYSIFNQAIEQQKRVCCEQTERGFVINEQCLLATHEPATLLHEILFPLGFSTDEIRQIFMAFGSQSGKRFESETHVAVHDRNKLFVESNVQTAFERCLITETDCKISLGEKCLCIMQFGSDNFQLERSAEVASLDFDKLTFPLVVRQWESGDSFVPLGMRGRKKVSDFLIDAKIPLTQKNNVLVLESAGEIAWILGMRISQNFAIDKNTERVLELRLK